MHVLQKLKFPVFPGGLRLVDGIVDGPMHYGCDNEMQCLGDFFHFCIFLTLCLELASQILRNSEGKMINVH